LLAYLIENRDRVVTRNELFEALWKDKVVSDSALGARLKDARKAVGDSGSKQEVIKTIHGRGYQFIAEVEKITEVVAEYTLQDAKPNLSALPLPDKPSIVVLPFQNLSADPEQEFFSDGITEDIITELTRFRDLFVIAKNSSFVFKNQEISVGDIGRQLGVRFAIEGSVRKSGDQIRITANLVDVVSGSQVWGDHYDRKLDDIFSVQDDVVKATILAVVGHLRHWEFVRVERIPPANLQAYDLVLQACNKIYEIRKVPVNEGIALLNRALEIAPEYAPAHGWLGCAHLLNSINRWVGDPNAARELALSFGKQAIRLDEACGVAHYALSEIYLYAYQNLDDARDHAERAIALNPSASQTISWMGFLRCAEGLHEEGVSLVNEALRLDPLAPGYYRQLLGACQYLAGNYEASILALHTSNLESIDPLNYLVAAYQAAGRVEEAQQTALKIIQTGRDEMELIPENWAEHLSQCSGFVRDQDRIQYKKHLVEAGIPNDSLES